MVVSAARLARMTVVPALALVVFWLVVLLMALAASAHGPHCREEGSMDPGITSPSSDVPAVDTTTTGGDAISETPPTPAAQCRLPMLLALVALPAVATSLVLPRLR